MIVVLFCLATETETLSEIRWAEIRWVQALASVLRPLLSCVPFKQTDSAALLPCEPCTAVTGGCRGQLARVERYPKGAEHLTQSIGSGTVTCRARCSEPSAVVAHVRRKGDRLTWCARLPLGHRLCLAHNAKADAGASLGPQPTLCFGLNPGEF
jgi:hypothetical protein